MATVGKLDDLAAALKAAAKEPPKDARKRHGAVKEAVAANLTELLDLRAKGYSDSALADIFRGKGFTVTAGTLKTYINALRAETLGPQRASKKSATVGNSTGNKGGNDKQSQPAPVAAPRPVERPKISETAAKPAAAEKPAKSAIRGNDLSGDA